MQTKQKHTVPLTNQSNRGQPCLQKVRLNILQNFLRQEEGKLARISDFDEYFY